MHVIILSLSMKSFVSLIILIRNFLNYFSYPISIPNFFSSIFKWIRSWTSNWMLFPSLFILIKWSLKASLEAFLIHPLVFCMLSPICVTYHLSILGLYKCNSLSNLQALNLPHYLSFHFLSFPPQSWHSCQNS